jgi:ribosomal protein S18 acetylase RimI-like enzyme
VHSAAFLHAARGLLARAARISIVVRTTLRTAQPEDAPGIARAHVAAWDGAFRGIVSDDAIAARTLEVRIAQWAEILRRPERVTVVCESDDAICGFASATPLDEPLFASYLETLYVAPDAWRAGIGKSLLAAVAGGLLDRAGIERDARNFDSVVYGFDDLTLLRKA